MRRRCPRLRCTARWAVRWHDWSGRAISDGMALSPGRYAMRDLLLSYAAQQARDLPDTDRRAATRRMMDHYLHSGFVASQRVPRRRPPIALSPPAPGVATEALADAREALAWIQREIPVLVAVARRAAELGFDTEAWQIPWTFAQFLHQS